MVGADDALCLDWRIVGCGDIARVCGAQVEVLKAIVHGMYYMKRGKLVYYFGEYGGGLDPPPLPCV